MPSWNYVFLSYTREKGLKSVQSLSNKLQLFCSHTSSSRRWSITVTIATTHRSLSIGCHGRLGSWISKMHYFIFWILIQERIIVCLSAIGFHLMRHLLLYKNIIVGLLNFLLFWRHLSTQTECMHTMYAFVHE